MEFAWNAQKNKMSDVKGLEKEQNREGKISNQDIDLTKTYLNYDLVISNLNLYQRVKKRIDEVKDVSKIQKNSVVDYSNIITVSKNQFEIWGINKTKEYFNTVYDYFCNEFGKENVVSAKIHFDETVPHMHLHFVPISLESGKLQARNVMTPKRINKVHTEAPRYLKTHGFDVERGKGVTGKNNIKNIHEFKQNKIKELDNNIYTLEKRLNAILSVYNGVEDIKTIKTHKTLIGAKISLKIDDYEKIISNFTKISLENENLKEKNKDLESENKDLNNKLEKANIKIKSFDYGVLDFENKKKKLKEQLEREIKIENKSQMDTLENNNKYLESENYKLELENKNQKDELKIFYDVNNINSDFEKNIFLEKHKNKNKDFEYELRF